MNLMNLYKFLTWREGSCSSSARSNADFNSFRGGGKSLKLAFSLLATLFLVDSAWAQTITIVNDKGVANLKAGDVVTYTVTVLNNTSAKISSQAISDPLLAVPTQAAPAVLIPNSLIVSGTSMTCSVPTTITNAISISGFSLLPGEDIKYRFQLKVPSTYSGTGTVAHTASYNGVTQSTSNNISAIPALTLTKTVGTDVTTGTVNKFGRLVYTITVKNTGTANANTVVLDDLLNTTNVAIMAVNNVIVTQNYNANYTVNNGNALADTKVNVSLGTMPIGSTATVKFEVLLKSTAVSPVTNTATATATNLTGGLSSGSASSNTVSNTINAAATCSNRNVYYLSYSGLGVGTVNDPTKPWQSFLQVVNAINAAGGNAVLRFLDSYYPVSVSGTTNPILSTPCVTIDGNYCLFDRNSGASVGFLEMANGANGDTIRNLRLTNFNKSPGCAFDVYGSSIAAPITGLVVDDVKLYATQSVKGASLLYVSGAKFTNCEWANNPFGAMDIKDATATFTDCNFYCNTRGGFGGAINVSENTSTANRVFTNLTFIRGKFSGNSGTGTASDGGGIYMNIGTLSIDGTEFDCNTSGSTSGGGSGGGALSFGSASASSGRPIVSITNAIFSKNSTATGGNGGAILWNSAGTLTLSNSIFTANTCTAGSGLGANKPNVTITNCTFQNGSGTAISGNPGVISNTTVKNNTAGISGTVTSLTNSLVCGNTGVNMATAPTTVTNSLYGTSAEAVNNATVTYTGYPNTCAAATAGWTFTNGATTVIQQTTAGDAAVAGYWLIENGDVITTSNIDVTGFSNVKIQARAASFGTVASIGALRIEYSTDGGSTWTVATGLTQPTSTTYVNSFGGASSVPFNIGSPNVSTLKFRFSNPTGGAVGNGIRFDNFNITYDNPITCASTSVGSTLTIGSYTCVSAASGNCPITPTGATVCATFSLGNVIMGSGCKFLNTYTGNFAISAPPILQPGQTVAVNISKLALNKSVPNNYQWRWLVVNSSGSIVQVVTPTGGATSTITLAGIATTFTPTTSLDGTYKVYGYYYNTSSLSAPVVGATLASLESDKCGSVSTSFGTFEVLKPIVIAVENKCTDNNFNACKDRLLSKVTVTGGYPEYCNGISGLYVPQYVLGIDSSYTTPAAWSNEMAGWVDYNSAMPYMEGWVSAMGLGAKVTDDANCTTYPFALDLATGAIPVKSCGQKITGNSLLDANGGTIDGTGIASASGSQLYVYLVSTDATKPTVVNRAVVNADGTYQFANGFVPDNTYTLVLSTNDLGLSSAATDLSSILGTDTTGTNLNMLPTGWSNSAEGTNATTGDGTVNGKISITTPAASNDLTTGTDFAVKQSPSITGTIYNDPNALETTDYSTASSTSAITSSAVSNPAVYGTGSNLNSTLSVLLIDQATGLVVAKTEVSATGTYTFANVVDGTYTTMLVPSTVATGLAVGAASPTASSLPSATPVWVNTGEGTRASSTTASIATTSGSTSINVGAADASKFLVGTVVSGAGIPSGTVVTAVDMITGAVTLSSAATATSAGVTLTTLTPVTTAGGADGIVTSIVVAGASVEGVDFGIQQKPTATGYTDPTAIDPATTTSVNIDLRALTGDIDGGIVAKIQITSWPYNVDQLVINGTSYPTYTAFTDVYTSGVIPADATVSIVPTITGTTSTTSSIATTSGSTSINVGASNASKFPVGTPVSGAGIPAGTVVTAVDAAGNVTLSNAATATSAGVTLTAGGVVIPFKAIDNGGQTSELATYTIPLKTVISGNVYNDVNGMNSTLYMTNPSGPGFLTPTTKGIVDGEGTNISSDLWVLLIDSNNKIAAKTAVGSTGAYSFEGIAVGTYSAMLVKTATANALIVGDDAASVTSTLPTNWENTGEGCPKVTAAVTSGSAVVTVALADVSKFTVGQAISGTGIPNGTTVASISGTTITLSQNATATSAATTLTTSNLGDGTANGVIANIIVSGSKTNIDFGIQEKPTATLFIESPLNPANEIAAGGVPANIFSKTSDVTTTTGDASAGTQGVVAKIKITAWPTGPIDTLKVGNKSYTAASFATNFNIDYPDGIIFAGTVIKVIPLATANIDTVKIPYFAIDNSSLDNATKGISAATTYNIPFAVGLPIELISFTAVNKGCKTNVLTWTTATEKNNSHFDVQRSVNGTSFETVGKVTGSGTTAQAHTYSFNDAYASGSAYYRLRQVDFDGQSVNSNVVFVKGCKGSGVDASIYPNPTNEELNIVLNVDNASEVSVNVYNTIGQLIISRANNSLRVGANTIKLSTMELAKGNYFLKVESAGQPIYTEIFTKN